MNVGIEARAALVNLGLAAAVLAAAFLLSGLPPREIALLLLKVQALLCGGLLVQALFAPARRELLDPSHPRGRLFLATAGVLALSLAGVFSAGLLALALWWICVLGLLLLVLGSYVWFLVRLP
jgi:hypothetical protein